MADPIGEPASGHNVPNPIDLHVGARLRLSRLQQGLDERQTADLLAVSFDQYASYERGEARLPAFLLFKASKVLKVPIAWFYEGLGAGSTLVSDYASSDDRFLEDGVMTMNVDERAALLDAYFRDIDQDNQEILIRLAGIMTLLRSRRPLS